ncbi:transporter substrate-binding domain-containing protein [Methanospirillum hungatei]|uniref:transporter substrate-binding domain-containing protein n=1 Tax=Methanospirillum hungatei TaxID=2203 RepID=UPI0026EC4B60|nr:transporter substrate-binding domain-containing protein [Methanospirillum hungatei]MCA1915245.1 transporter substrate-binding domain-containing protein [Methanospirillum hungatei]
MYKKKESSHLLPFPIQLSLILSIFILCFLIPVSSGADEKSGVEYQYWADENYPPFEFKDNSGNAAGFSVDIIRAIGKEAGFTVNVTPHPWGEVKAALSNHTIDLSGTMAYDINRTDRFVFSVPIVTLNWYLYVQEHSDITSLDQLKGKRIILASGDIWEEKLENARFPANITIVPDYREQLLQMSAGGYDAAIINKPVASYLMEQLGIRNLKPAGEPIERLKLCVAAHKSDPDLIGKINEGIVIINRNGEYERISNLWFAPIERQYEAELFQKVFLYVLLPVLGLLFVIFMWIWTLRRMVARKTVELQNELSARIAAQNALLASEKKYRALFEDSILGIFRIDPDGRFLEMNPAFAGIYGYKNPEEMKQALKEKDTPLSSLTNKENPIYGLLKQQSEVTGFELEEKRQDGTPFWINVHMKVVCDDNGAIEFYEGTAEDVTRRKMAEYENELALAQIKKNIAELSILNDGIRNPLTIIATLSENLGPYENAIIQEQIKKIDLLINQLDIRWVESEKIINYLRKHHDIHITIKQKDT